MKRIPLFLLALTSLTATSGSGLYTTDDLKTMTQKLAQKRTRFASQDLQRYSNHYTMLAYRGQTGSSEVHQHEADIFIVQSGGATLVTGGDLLNAHTEKPGEIRGTSIKGGERRHVGPGDIIHIEAGVPHQLLVDEGKPICYFVVKVTGQ